MPFATHAAMISLPLFLVLALPQQEPVPANQDPEPTVEKEETPAVAPTITVTAERLPTAEIDIPRSTTLIEAEEYQRRAENVALDALSHEIGIWLEHRTGTTADPVIRGLSGANLLTLIDGDTLSTFWGEGGFAGDDMYGKIDPWSVDRIEVVRGPASVLYGSNALGGVIQFFTRRPPVEFTQGERVWGGEFRSSFSTNNRAWRERLDLWGAGERSRWRVGGDLAGMSDFRAGGGQRMAPTGGQEGNFDLNTEFLLSDYETLLVNIQRVHRNPLYRFYRPTQSNQNDRLGVHVELQSTRSGPLWDQAQLRLYYQDKKDQRFWDNGDRGVAQWKTYTVDAQAESQLGNHRLVYGLAFHLDRGESPDDEQFTIYPGSLGPPQKPAPDSDWWNLGAYIQDDWAFSDNWSLLASTRYDHFLFRSMPDAFYVPPAGSPPGVDDMRSSQGAFTGGLALSRHFGDDAHVYASWYRGFRQFAPNFGIRQHGWGVLVPNGLLDPIESDTFELGAKVEEETLQMGTALYYTGFRNFQNIVAGSYNGSNFYDFNQNGSFEANERVYQTTANGSAYVKGVEWSAEVRLDRWMDHPRAEDWSFGGGFMWNIGQDRSNDVPLRHTHPARALAHLYWVPQQAQNGLYAGIEAEAVDAFTRIDPARLNSDVGYLNDPQDSTSGLIRPWGIPGYALFDLRAGFAQANGVEWAFAVENLLDRNYRGAHSRVDGMGRNFTVTVTVPL